MTSSAILVWDLDQTLVANYFTPEDPQEPILNTNALEIMYRAKKSRKVAANLLLTNNADAEFVGVINMALINAYNRLYPEDQVDTLFDVIYTAERDSGEYVNPRSKDETVPGKDYAAKRVADVENMLKEIGLELNNAGRIWFFDDLKNHILTTELVEAGFADNFVQIIPPFRSVADDATDYSKILQLFNMVGGRYRKTRKNRRGAKAAKAAKAVKATARKRKTRKS